LKRRVLRVHHLREGGFGWRWCDLCCWCRRSYVVDVLINQYTFAYFTGKSQLCRGAMISSELKQGLNRWIPSVKQEITLKVVNA
jgi:hypothetical protein